MLLKSQCILFKFSSYFHRASAHNSYDSLISYKMDGWTNDSKHAKMSVHSFRKKNCFIFLDRTFAPTRAFHILDMIVFSSVCDVVVCARACVCAYVRVCECVCVFCMREISSVFFFLLD